MSFSYVENETKSPAKIKVIGVGGGGGNAINNMIESNLIGVDFIAANTDAQALGASKAQFKIQLGEKLTKGRGAGANPQTGKDAALESADNIRATLSGADMVFIAAGFGGGTGTGASPVIAKICREIGALTVVVGTKPFSFEAKKRTKQADDGIYELRESADAVIIIPNDRLKGLALQKARLIDMFLKADEILHHSVKGITDLLMIPGLVNLDFADVKTAMSKSGMAIMGIGIASGENRAIEASERAISHPLLEDISINGAKGVLMNITSTSGITMDETTEACERIHKEVGDDAEIIWGHSFDESMGEEIRVTVVATGIVPPSGMRQAKPKEVGCRGVVRDLTPADYMKPSATIHHNTHKKAVGESISSGNRMMRGQTMDNEDFDIPTFLRKKAD
ncbi:MAG: cell division protein FtsZ [Desulfobacterales bacterium]|nr:cell division protein FtsZ [Desulfobacterales bacterium]